MNSLENEKSNSPENRRPSLLDISSFKSPEQAAQERRDSKTFWPRMVFVVVLSLILGAILSGLLGIFTIGGFLAVSGMFCFVLTMALIKEAQ
jgi:uncharacterized membrane protein YoaK (UPF0700 family)